MEGLDQASLEERKAGRAPPTLAPTNCSITRPGKRRADGKPRKTEGGEPLQAIVGHLLDVDNFRVQGLGSPGTVEALRF